MDVIRTQNAEGLSRKNTDACGSADDAVTACSKCLRAPTCQLPRCTGRHDLVFFPMDVPTGQVCEHNGGGEHSVPLAARESYTGTSWHFHSHFSHRMP